MKHSFIDIKTGKVTYKDFTPEEISKAEKRKAEFKAKQAEIEQRKAKLESAKAKLTALGLDEAEVQAILGL